MQTRGRQNRVGWMAVGLTAMWMGLGAAAQVNAEVRAVVMVDARLYAEIQPELDEYIELAEMRRGFDILLDASLQLDDQTYQQIFNRILFTHKIQNWNMEGVLMVGNIKLPSFYKVRGDNLAIRYWPAYYEMWNISWSRYYDTGDIDPVCDGTNEPYCQGWIHDPDRDEPHTVPAHDLDDLDTIANPDIWTAYMPVGGAEGQSYADYGNQLRPYLQKLIAHYKGQNLPDERMYMVSNDLFSGAFDFWNLYGDVTKVDHYAMSPEPAGSGNPCMSCGRDAYDCYVRTPLENWSDNASFVADYYDRENMGEDWQIADIYMDHMENNEYEFVMVNVHSGTEGSIINSSQASTLTDGGMIMLGTGCSVTGFIQPSSPSPTTYGHYNDNVLSTYPTENILCNYLYGSSDFLAATGSPFNRGHSGQMQIIIDEMKNNGAYLGQAHKERITYLCQNAGNTQDLKERLNEMLLGDPFLDVQPESYDAYSLAWDFDDSTFQGWTVHNTAPGVGVRNPAYFTPTSSDYLALPGDGGMPDSPYATFDLPIETNSWEFSALVAWDASNRLSDAGLGYAYSSYPTDWAYYYGGGSGSLDIVWDDEFAPEWFGPRLMFDNALVDGSTSNPVNAGEAVMTIKYNVPSNPGQITFEFTPVTYDDSAVDGPKLVGTCPTWSGDIDPITVVRLSSADSWSEVFFDNVTFTSHGTPPPDAPPAITAATSYVSHGSAGYLGVDLLASASVDPRQGGPEVIEVTFDQPIVQQRGTVDDVTLSAGSLSSLFIQGDDTLVMHVDNIPSATPINIEFNGIVAADNVWGVVDDELCIRLLTGDVTGEGYVNIFDLLNVRNKMGTPVMASTFRHDVNPDGYINIFDLLTVRNNLSQSVVSCP